jgi:hypothetical protein
MIKPGKVRSQPMKANYIGETDINEVGKYFRISSSIALNFFLNFKIRGVLSLKHT